MHLLAARVGEHNAVVISQGTLAKLAGASRRGVQNAIAILVQDRWIELRQIGERGTINAHVINDRAIWIGSRDGLRYSLFSAMVVVSEEEQPDREELDNLAPFGNYPAYILMSGNCLPAMASLRLVSHPFPGWRPIYRRCVRPQTVNLWKNRKALRRSRGAY